jgi:hypothetical protein
MANRLGATVKVAQTYGDVGAPIAVRTKFPAGTRKFRVEVRRGGKWLYGPSIGTITSKTKRRKAVSVAANVLPAWGPKKYRISGTVGGSPVSSPTFRLTGYKWVPLGRALDWTSVETYGVFADRSLPVFHEMSEQNLYQGWDNDLQLDSSTPYNCRQVTVGVRWEPFVTGGTASIEVTTANGLAQTLTVDRSQQVGVQTFTLDGSPVSARATWTDFDTAALGDAGKDALFFGGQGWCSGSHR